MGLQGFEGCDIPCEPGWQLQATDADCAEEDGGPIRQCTGVGSTRQVVQMGNLGCSPAVGRLFAGARLSWWLGRDVVESQLLGRGVRRGNSTRNHALSGCSRLIRLLSRCLLSATTRDDFAASQGPT